MADAASAREQAREILSGRQYRDTDVPQPFKGPLRWVGDRIEDVGDWLGGLFDDVDASVPGGSWVLWVLLGAAVAGAAVIVARAVIRRRAEAAEVRGEEGERPDPAALEREAWEAEQAGEFERAVRLRFRAGVVRLEPRLDPGGLRTTGALSASLRSERFDALGADFDAIAYGGREAAARDASEAREGWAEVVSSRSGAGGRS